MISAVGFLCLLSALVSTGYSLTCIECSEYNSTSCTGDSVLCPAQFCASVFIKESNPVESIMQIKRSCATEEQCSETGSATYGYVRRHMITSCCDSDDCTPEVPECPEATNEPNGNSCPNCFPPTLDECESGEQAQCSDNEDKCFVHVFKHNDFAFKIGGCSTESMCQPDKFNEYSYEEVTTTCTQATQ
ncbi:phospholipase A2 inhibitor subunit gamma B-like [Xenopus laevis]|uniref:Phospholipase A2 inhibitor subunit gamma B-like n=1 Tax=Xenopus laevis TaxID=8355 RepID=A0A8J1LDN9_XENLA|nr:phospholipase A2 inhibitor subunit gamma B-like [Xenopus laevis]